MNVPCRAVAALGSPAEIADYQDLIKRGDPSPLHKCIEMWIRRDRDALKAGASGSAVTKAASAVSKGEVAESKFEDDVDVSAAASSSTVVKLV